MARSAGGAGGEGRSTAAARRTCAATARGTVTGTRTVPGTSSAGRTTAIAQEFMIVLLPVMTAAQKVGQRREEKLPKKCPLHMCLGYQTWPASTRCGSDYKNGECDPFAVDGVNFTFTLNLGVLCF